MKTITRKYKVYKYKELPETIKEKVLESLWDINVDHEWWNFIYEDAKEIGLEITGFDIDRGSYCKGNFTQSAEDVAKAIIESHGENCETYKTAQNYLSELGKLINSNTYDEDNIDTDAIDKDFLYSLLEDYRIILQHEYEYLTSREAIVETIEANDYDFTEDGKIFH